MPDHTEPLSYRLHRWLYEQEPRLVGDTDPRVLGEAIGALGVNAGALLGRALVAEGEEAFEATLAVMIVELRRVAHQTADRIRLPDVAAVANDGLRPH